MSTSIHLVVIDPQNDFCDIVAAPGDPVGLELPDGTKFRSSLPVPGALDDMRRLATMIDRVGPRLEDIHVTLDSHRVIDVGHPGMWRDEDGNRPAPFTVISATDVESGRWTPRNPTFRQRLQDYARGLEAAGQYQVMVWPPHCLIGSWGHNIQDDLMQSLLRWEQAEFANVDFVTKGTNSFTEHYGALMAEVPDPSDPGTQLNTSFLDVLARFDPLGGRSTI